MKIEKLNSNVQITETASLLQAIVKASKSHSFASDNYLKQMLQQLNALSDSMSAAINKNTVVSELEQKDELRDNTLRALFYLHKGYMYYPQSNVAEAAQSLNGILDKYGFKIIDESYVNESAHIESMLTDLSDSKARAALRLLPGLSDLIEQVNTTQQNFVNSYVAYKEAKAQRDEYSSATDIKKEALALLNGQFVVYLRAMQQAQPQTYDKFADTVSQLISDNNMQAKKRRAVVK